MRGTVPAWAFVGVIITRDLVIFMLVFAYFKLRRECAALRFLVAAHIDGVANQRLRETLRRDVERARRVGAVAPMRGNATPRRSP